MTAGSTLYLGATRMRIIGRNLNAEVRENVRLFGAILRRRVPWIAETDGTKGFTAGETELVIERIETDC